MSTRIEVTDEIRRVAGQAFDAKAWDLRPHSECLQAALQAALPLIVEQVRKEIASRAKELWLRQDTFICSNPRTCGCEVECKEAVEDLAAAIRKGVEQ
jgi:hypothetical protein